MRLIEMRYAESLLIAAEEKNIIDDVAGEFESFTEGVRRHSVFLNNPYISVEEKKKVLSEVLSGRVSDIFYNFVMLLSEKSRLPYVFGIYAEFERLLREFRKTVHVKLYSPWPIEGAQLESLKAILADKGLYRKSIDVKSPKLFFEMIIDRDLIGGFRAVCDDLALDCSVRKRIGLLRKDNILERIGENGVKA